jgi:hypothetical protein
MDQVHRGLTCTCTCCLLLRPKTLQRDQRVESRLKFKSYLSLARTGSRCAGEACTMEKEGTCISWRPGGGSNPFACGGVSRNAKAAWEGWKQSMHVPCFSTSRTSPSSSSGASMPETAIVLPPPATCYIRGFEDWLIKRQQTRTLYIVLWRCIVCCRATW